MLSRPEITKGSSAPSVACCPTLQPPPPGCHPGTSRRPQRPSRRFSRAFMSSYSPLTNTSRKIGKVFWIVSVINCRYIGDSPNSWNLRFSGAAATGRHTPSSRLAQIRFPDVVVTDSKAPAVMCKVSLASRTVMALSVWPTWNYCVTQHALCCCLSFEFEKILILKVEFDAILQYFIKTFETLLFLEIFQLLFWKCLKMREVHFSFLNIMVGGEISLSIKRKSGWWIFYFPGG